MISVSIDGVLAPQLNRESNQSTLDSTVSVLSDAHATMMERRHKDIGFYDLPLTTNLADSVDKEVTRLKQFASDLIVLGIGGSSLGGQTLVNALAASPAERHSVRFIDNVDPDTLAEHLTELKPSTTAVAVITKSGGTVETLAQLLIVRRWLEESLTADELTKHFIFITDPENGFLRTLAHKESIATLDVPTTIGGRFSALSAVGLLPAAFAGVDINALLAGAAELTSNITADASLDNLSLKLAAATLLSYQVHNATTLVCMPYRDRLRTLSSWFVQLWGESLGKYRDPVRKKDRVGQTPIAAVGATDQHAQVQLFVEGPQDKAVILIQVKQGQHRLQIPSYWSAADDVNFLHGKDLQALLDAELQGTRGALLKAGVPVIDITLDQLDARSCGALMMLFQGACALMGVALGVEPFDQPGVETGKQIAFALLGRRGYKTSDVLL